LEQKDIEKSKQESTFGNDLLEDEELKESTAAIVGGGKKISRVTGRMGRVET
jgi:hypothetical protein